MTNKIQQQEAKLRELTQWNKGVYVEIKNNGQDMGYDGKNNSGFKFIKAFLCAGAF